MPILNVKKLVRFLFDYQNVGSTLRAKGDAMADEREKLLEEIATLKKKVDEMSKKVHFLEAVQEHYSRELEHYANVEAKIRDLFVTVNDRHDLINSVDYALRLYQRESSDEQQN